MGEEEAEKALIFVPKNLSGQILHKGRVSRHEIPVKFWKIISWRGERHRNQKGSYNLPFMHFIREQQAGESVH